MTKRIETLGVRPFFVAYTNVAEGSEYMGWDQRGKKRYYYRTQRQNGRPVRTYFGISETAELAATADARLRVRSEMDAREWQQRQENLAAAEALLKELFEESDLLVQATLILAGYHQHDRGAWRLNRVQQSSD